MNKLRVSIMKTKRLLSINTCLEVKLRTLLKISGQSFKQFYAYNCFLCPSVSLSEQGRRYQEWGYNTAPITISYRIPGTLCHFACKEN